MACPKTKHHPATVSRCLLHEDGHAGPCVWGDGVAIASRDAALEFALKEALVPLLALRMVWWDQFGPDMVAQIDRADRLAFDALRGDPAPADEARAEVERLRAELAQAHLEIDALDNIAEERRDRAKKAEAELEAATNGRAHFHSLWMGSCKHVAEACRTLGVDEDQPFDTWSLLDACVQAKDALEKARAELAEHKRLPFAVDMAKEIATLTERAEKAEKDLKESEVRNFAMSADMSRDQEEIERLRAELALAKDDLAVALQARDELVAELRADLERKGGAVKMWADAAGMHRARACTAEEALHKAVADYKREEENNLLNANAVSTIARERLEAIARAEKAEGEAERLRGHFDKARAELAKERRAPASVYLSAEGQCQAEHIWPGHPVYDAIAAVLKATGYEHLLRDLSEFDATLKKAATAGKGGK